MKRRPVLSWVVTLVVGVVFGMMLVGRLSAAAPPSSDGLGVREQNLDGDGYIQIHEQGVVPVADNDASLTVDGSISVDNFPASLAVLNGGGTVSVDQSHPLDSMEFAADAIVTDLLAAEVGDGTCGWFFSDSDLRIIMSSDDVDNNVQLHLSSGVVGPVRLEVLANSGSCGVRYYWTGTEKPTR